MDVISAAVSNRLKTCACHEYTACWTNAECLGCIKSTQDTVRVNESGTFLPPGYFDLEEERHQISTKMSTAL